MALGWTGANADTGQQRAADSPGHKLRLTYAPAAGDLQGIDLGWIKRSRRSRSRSRTRCSRTRQRCRCSTRPVPRSSPQTAARYDRALSASRRPGPTDTALRPPSRSRRSSPTSSRRHRRACGHRARARPGARRRRSARARCATRSARTRARLPTRGPGATPRRVRSAAHRPDPSARGAPRAGSGARRALASIASMIAGPRRRIPDGWMPRICSSARRFVGWRLASSTSGGSASTEPTGRSSCEAVRSRHAASALATARAGVELVDARQALPGGLGIALVGGRLEPTALLARPLEAVALAAGASGARR